MRGDSRGMGEWVAGAVRGDSRGMGEWVAGAVRGDSRGIEADNTRKAKRLAAP